MIERASAHAQLSSGSAACRTSSTAPSSSRRSSRSSSRSVPRRSRRPRRSASRAPRACAAGASTRRSSRPRTACSCPRAARRASRQDEPEEGRARRPHRARAARRRGEAPRHRRHRQGGDRPALRRLRPRERAGRRSRAVAQSLLKEMYQSLRARRASSRRRSRSRTSTTATAAIPVDFRDPKTKPFDMKVYERAVRNLSNRSTTEFREEQARELLAAKMRDAVREPVRISEDEAWDEYERRVQHGDAHVRPGEGVLGRALDDRRDAGGRRRVGEGPPGRTSTRRSRSARRTTRPRRATSGTSS